MRIFAAAALFTAAILLHTTAHAVQFPKYNISLRDVIATLEKPFDYGKSGEPEITSVRADFFQRSTIAGKNRELRAEGQMLLKTASSNEPLKFRFDYFRPTRQEIVCDGNSLWVYLPENRQVILSDVSDFFDPARSGGLGSRGVNFLQGLGRISKDFNIGFNRVMNDQSGNFILELTPKRSSATIQKLYITVSRLAMELRFGTRPQTALPPAVPTQQNPFPILSTTVVDHDGNSTTMEFINPQTNVMITDLIFKFSPPANIQVVRP